jgi:uncharacterized repeat protein (TIGR03847 family)
MSASFDLEAPDHFTTGAIGPAGQRIFYLQAREAGTLVTLKAEKEQVGLLGEYLARLLARQGSAQEERVSEIELLEPLDPVWAIGSIGVGYDEARERFLIEATELQEEESAEEPATARIRITRAQAAAFVERARASMKGGRPLCPFCSLPVDPGGHVCPRSNGHIAAE